MFGKNIRNVLKKNCVFKDFKRPTSDLLQQLQVQPRKSPIRAEAVSWLLIHHMSTTAASDRRQSADQANRKLTERQTRSRLSSWTQIILESSCCLSRMDLSKFNNSLNSYAPKLHLPLKPVWSNTPSGCWTQR